MLTLHWNNRTDMKRFHDAVAALGSDRRMQAACSRALNRAGSMGRTQLQRTLTKQTGLPRKTIVRAIRIKRALNSSLAYHLITQGGDITLKHFKAAETRPGVKASPFGRRQLFAHRFMKGGRFPKRVALQGMGGHVWRRTGADRKHIEKVRSGVYIPKEMIKGESKRAFDTVAMQVLPQRIAHEVTRLGGGVLG